MDEYPSIPSRALHVAQAERQYRTLASAARIVVGAVAVALCLRTLVAEPFNIPSESMLPTLLGGDYLFVSKWPYGLSRYSLPFAPPLFDGRVGGGRPQRGDVVVFKTPRDNRTDFIKRVIGLPGDRVRMVGGQIELNGRLVPKVQTSDFIVPTPRGGDCSGGSGHPDYRRTLADGSVVCRYPRYLERLGKRDYAVLDLIANDVRDNTPLVIVPADHYFVEGDNRDDSADSRLSIAEGGVGMVPQENLVGRAERIFYSTTGTARLTDPPSWLRSLRLSRIGDPL